MPSRLNIRRAMKRQETLGDKMGIFFFFFFFLQLKKKVRDATNHAYTHAILCAERSGGCSGDM